VFDFFFSSRRRHTRWPRDWSSDVCSSDLFRRVRATPRTPGSRRGKAPLPAFPRATLQSASSWSLFTLDETTKHFPSPKGAHLDSSHRNAQHTPDLMKLHSFDMTKDDHFSVLHGKPGERAVER